MNKFSLLSSTILLCTSPLTFADYNSSVDEDGCWDARTSAGTPCLVMTNARWSKNSDGKLLVDYKNQCANRVYFTYAIETKTGEGKGATGLKGYGKKTEYNYNATGNYGYDGLVGSVKGSQDWVCRSKYK